ncbi:MAG: acyl-CoA synthetase [Acidimicrobiales bacterium]|nr:acyl-CoA synthetase [Acidimicrobiales bacterium]
MSGFNLADLWEAVADCVPDRVALHCGEQRRTYAQLEEQSNRLAHWYLEQGIQPGDHIGLYLQNCVEYVEATLAAYKVRAVPININYRYTAGELEHLFNDADLVGVVHQWGFTNRVTEVEPHVPTLQWKLATGSTYDDALASSSPARDFGPRSGDDHYILYTGGTTGLPKGVVWRQEDAFFACMGGGNPALPEVTSVAELVQRIAPDQSTFLLLAPLMHAAGAWVVLLHLFSGNKVVLWSGSLDPREVWRTIEREKVTATSTVGDAVMRPLLDTWDDFDPKPDIESLAVVSSGGAPLSTALRDRFLATFPSIPLSDGYGSSETGIQAGRIFVGPTVDEPEPQFTAQQAVVMDEATRRPVVPGSGIVGRVARTGRIPLGYHKDPARSATTFVEWDGRRWSLTGDMATVAADGTITLLGRGSLCINTGGEKVYPEEVEGVLRQLRAVYDVVVVGVPDERWGERVVAIVQLAPGTEPTEGELMTLVRASLAGYKVPKQVVFVDEVVRSPSGKADYRWAAEVAASA